MNLRASFGGGQALSQLCPGPNPGEAIMLYRRVEVRFWFSKSFTGL